MVATPTRAEVAVVYDGDPTSTGTGDLSDSDADDLITAAVEMYEQVYSDQLLFLPEGSNADQAVKWLAAHKWAIALGDTVDSESQGGANATYTSPTSTERSLGRTKYGQEFLEYFRDRPNIGVFRTR